MKINNYTIEPGADLRDVNLSDANLLRADLRGANLSGAVLLRTSLCHATIDGAKVSPDDIGGPGHILCALTEDEWEMIKEGRNAGRAA